MDSGGAAYRRKLDGGNVESAQSEEGFAAPRRLSALVSVAWLLGRLIEPSKRLL